MAEWTSATVSVSVRSTKRELWCTREGNWCNVCCSLAPVALWFHTDKLREKGLKHQRGADSDEPRIQREESRKSRRDTGRGKHFDSFRVKPSVSEAVSSSAVVWGSFLKNLLNLSTGSFYSGRGQTQLDFSAWEQNIKPVCETRKPQKEGMLRLRTGWRGFSSQEHVVSGTLIRLQFKDREGKIRNNSTQVRLEASGFWFDQSGLSSSE